MLTECLRHRAWMQGEHAPRPGSHGAHRRPSRAIPRVSWKVTPGEPAVRGLGGSWQVRWGGGSSKADSPGSPRPGTPPRRTETSVHTKPCACVSAAAVTTVQTCPQAKPTPRERTSRGVCPHEATFLSHEDGGHGRSLQRGYTPKTSSDVKGACLSRSRSAGLLLEETSRRDKSVETESRVTVARGWGRGRVSLGVMECSGTRLR